LPRHGQEVLFTRQRNYEASIGVVEEQAGVHGWGPDLLTNAAWLSARAGKEAEARALLAEIEALNSSVPYVQIMTAATYVILGEQDKALAIVEYWESFTEETRQFNIAGVLAIIYGELKNADRAMYWLTRSREAHSMWMLFLDYEEFDFLRDDPRFIVLVRELDLPEDRYLLAAR
jgi:hypothetical protein